MRGLVYMGGLWILLSVCREPHKRLFAFYIHNGATHVTTKAFSDAAETPVRSTNSPPMFSAAVPASLFCIKHFLKKDKWSVVTLGTGLITSRTDNLNPVYRQTRSIWNLSEIKLLSWPSVGSVLSHTHTHAAYIRACIACQRSNVSLRLKA